MEQQRVCPLPGRYKPATFAQSVRLLRQLGVTYWLKALLYGAVAALVIGIPTVLIPNGLFMREVGTTPADYVIFALSAALIGMTWALPLEAPRADAEKRTLLGAVTTFFAVGCPTCNKIVLILLGTSGALTYFAPLQPLLGVGAVVLIVAALRRRLGEMTVVKQTSTSPR